MKTSLGSPFGPVAIIWEQYPEPAVVRVVLSRPGSPATDSAAFRDAGPVGSCRIVDSLAEGIARLLAGRTEALPVSVAALERCPPFQRTVLQIESNTQRGRVVTYSRLAELTGKPGAARAVGNALAGNPFPLIIPCHRAIRADRTPGGFQGGPAMKRALLEMEGVSFDGSGRIERSVLMPCCRRRGT